MKKILFLILFAQFTFAQKNANAADLIYASLDKFIANPTPSGIKKLEETEENFWSNPRPKSADEKLAIVILNCNKGFYENQFGQLFNSISSYEKALALFQKSKLKNYDIIEYCLKPLGNLYTITGDYTSAENTIKQYLYLAIKDNNTPHKISGIINLSAVYKSIGKNQEAIDLLENCYKTEVLSDEKKAIILSLLGENYLAQNNLDKARKSFEKAEILIPNFTIYKNLVAVYTKEKNYNQAEIYVQKAKSSLSDISKRDLSQLYIEEAKLLSAQKKYGESQKAIQEIFKQLIPNYNPKKILPDKKNLYPENLLIDALDVLATTFVAQKNYAKATECYNLTFEIDSKFSSSFFYESTHLINSSDIRSRVERSLNIYELQYEKSKDQKLLEKAFELEEKTKSVALKNYISLAKKYGNKEQKETLYKIHELSNTILKEQQKGKNADLEIINKALNLQNEKISSLKKTFKNNTTADDSKIDFGELFSKLENDDATLTAYFYGKKKVYIFDLEDKKIRFHSFENSVENKKTITDYLDYFAESATISNNIFGYQKQSFKLYKLLQLQKIKNKNHLIIPDGLLHFISFESLLTQASQKTDFSKLPYLIKDEVISYSTSTEFYINSEKPDYKNQSVLGVFPVFENTNKTLSFSIEELKAIQKLYKGIYLDKNQATYSNFLKNCKNESILHLSTHASSGNVEMPATISFFDQDVLYSNLYSLNINPDLVVLSACETGIGKLYGGEGSLSIARGFQNAGAKNLLFSLWKVNDYTTSVLMKNFYENCEKNQSFFEANYNAKIDFLNDEKISNSKKSPYYWSAFVFYGDIEATSDCNYWYLFGGIIIIIFTLVFYQKQKKGK